MTVQVVLLMAGLGSRFTAAGYAMSKPLIEVEGRPMFVAALSGLSNLGVDRLVVVMRRQQIDEELLDEHVRSAWPSAQICVLPELTRGAAESAAAAASELEPSRPVVVLDCDLSFSSTAYQREVEASALSGGPDVVLLTFAADDPRYSYVAVDGAGRVLEIAEKCVISNQAVTGAYYFASAELFLAATRDVLAAGRRAGVAEYYMSEVVHLLLERGAAVQAAPVDEFASFGTPEELEAHLLSARSNV